MRLSFSLIKAGCLLTFLSLCLIPAFSLFAQQNKAVKIYKLNIKQEIAPPISRLVSKGIDEAHRIKADYIFIEMNTYGGLLDAADSIRTKILQSNIPTLILIQNNAASAGALIALACDSIYMQPGSTIGAATVVDQNGKVADEKYQSYMRKKMRATAEQNARNPDVAEAMVEPDIEISGIKEKGKILTFTTSEAVKNKFCEAELKNLREIMNRLQIKSYEVVEQEITTIDKIISWLINPLVSGILIAIIIGGIYFELQTPGIGFPILAAITAAVLYFAPHYLEGLAQNWEIFLFLIGIILLMLELFVIPGFGIVGISGIVLIILGLALSMIENIGFDLTHSQAQELLQASLISVLSAALSIIFCFYLGYNFFNSNTFKRLILTQSENSQNGFTTLNLKEKQLIGKNGYALTLLRPVGKINIDGEIFDALSQNGFIEKGQAVRVINYENAQLIVELSANHSTI